MLSLYCLYFIISYSLLLYYLDCIPNCVDADPTLQKTAVKLKKTLQDAGSESEKKPMPNYDLVQSKVTLQALGINLGDKVVVGGVKVRFSMPPVDLPFGTY